MSACEKAGEWKTALALLEEMEGKSVEVRHATVMADDGSDGL